MIDKANQLAPSYDLAIFVRTKENVFHHLPANTKPAWECVCLLVPPPTGFELFNFATGHNAGRSGERFGEIINS